MNHVPIFLRRFMAVGFYALTDAVDFADEEIASTPNYPLRHHLIETIKPFIKEHWRWAGGVWP